jgi:hypothetical protein
VRNVTNMGRKGSAIRAASCIATSWLILQACGGITERQVAEEEQSGTAAGSVSNEPSQGGSSSTNQAGSQPLAGTGVALAGSSTGTPKPKPKPKPKPTPTPSGVACYNDSDCPSSSCGGEVCNWTKTSPMPQGMKAFVCNPAGTDPKGRDGWCTTDADCKCVGLGAKCIAPYCTFTRPSDAP